MPAHRNTSSCSNVFRLVLLLLAAVTWSAVAQSSAPPAVSPVTNLLQLVELLNREERVVRDVRLEATVCSASDPSVGVLVLKDASDTELVQLGAGLPKLSAGERIRIENKNCLLRRREMGVQISPAPVVDNDKIHARLSSYGGLSMSAGRHPVSLEWFSEFRENYLETTWQVLYASVQNIPDSALFHAATNEHSGQIVFLPGLQAECFEGKWERVPDFDLLKPVKSGVVTNFDVGFATRNELVAMRFRGYLDVPTNSYFTFTTRSADGSLLFIGNRNVSITTLGKTTAPEPEAAIIGEVVANPYQQGWLSVEGRVGSVAAAGKGAELLLYAERNAMRVQIADVGGGDLSVLSNAQVRVTGVGGGVFNLSGGLMLGKLSVASIRDLKPLANVLTTQASAVELQKVRQVQTLPLDEARDGRPVHIRGVVTAVGGPYDFWVSVQDETRGIFVDFHNASNNIPVDGDFYEVIGHSGVGDFAPVVLADQLVRLGKGELPEPVRPTWNALNNGSLDVQWVEFQGLVTDVRSNTLSMLLSDGQMDVQVEGVAVSSLKSLEKSVVRVRGVLFAVWNATREVRVGRILMRNASITVDIPAPANPFDAVLKTPRELLLFDAQATAFQRVKVLGQVVHADPKRVFVMNGKSGLRILPVGPVDLRAGDLLEAVGYPDISGPAPLLREAIVHKTGTASLPAARLVTGVELGRSGLDSTLVRVTGKLVGLHSEQDSLVLEMQSGTHLFLARLAGGEVYPVFQPGSRLTLNGVYVGQGRTRQSGNEIESFELHINSPADITILSKPSWWTLQRLLSVVGVLIVILMLAAFWITQLRRQVERRTRQLQHEIREREHAERQHALEAERSRIARDLHDDLGSSLTEISVLASTGRHASAGDTDHPTLFRAIANKVHGLISALDVIVWAVDPEDNSLQSLADYLSGYVGEYLSASGITCRFKIPMVFPPVMLDGRVRHDLLLAVKETLNNIVRHANATEVEFRIAVAEGVLEIVVADNGSGFDVAAVEQGNGLENLSARLAKCGGSCFVESQVGDGTTVKIRLPVPANVSQ